MLWKSSIVLFLDVILTFTYSLKDWGREL